MIPSLGFGQAKLGPDPTQLWKMPSGGWAGAKCTFGSAKRALDSAQRTWLNFFLSWLSAQTSLIYNMYSQSQKACGCSWGIWPIFLLRATFFCASSPVQPGMQAPEIRFAGRLHQLRGQWHGLQPHVHGRASGGSGQICSRNWMGQVPLLSIQKQKSLFFCVLCCQGLYGLIGHRNSVVQKRKKGQSQAASFLGLTAASFMSLQMFCNFLRLCFFVVVQEVHN